MADENFNGNVIRGLLLRRPEIDLVRVQDLGLSGADDPAVLAAAAAAGRIVLTYDRAAVPHFANDRITAGEAVAGVFVAGDRMSVGQTIDELLLIDACSEMSEWSNRILFLPL